MVWFGVAWRGGFGCGVVWWGTVQAGARADSACPGIWAVQTTGSPDRSRQEGRPRGDWILGEGAAGHVSKERLAVWHEQEW